MEGSRQLGGQLGFSLLTLGCGEVVQPLPGKEVIDHAHTVVLACNNGQQLTMGLFYLLTNQITLLMLVGICQRFILYKATLQSTSNCIEMVPG